MYLSLLDSSNPQFNFNHQVTQDNTAGIISNILEFTSICFFNPTKFLKCNTLLNWLSLHLQASECRKECNIKMSWDHKKKNQSCSSQPENYHHPVVLGFQYHTPFLLFKTSSLTHIQTPFENVFSILISVHYLGCIFSQVFKIFFLFLICYLDFLMYSYILDPHRSMCPFGILNLRGTTQLFIKLLNFPNAL